MNWLIEFLQTEELEEESLERGVDQSSDADLKTPIWLGR